MPRWLPFALLIVLGLGWGSTQSLGKIAVGHGAPPMALVVWQLVICTAVLGALTALRRKPVALDAGALRFYAVVAVLGTLAPSMTFFISVARLPAGVMSILISVVPMIAFPLGLALRVERFSRRRLAGLALGLGGVLLIALPRAALPAPEMAGFLPIALLGPLFYALEGLYVGRFGLRGMDAISAMFGASAMGVVLGAPVMLALGQGYVPPTFAAPEAAMLFMSALHAVLYAAFVWLAAHSGAVFATQTSYIVTASGMVWAMALLGERFSPMVLLAAAVMLAGIGLVQPQGRGKGAAV